jgi:hypothetical protein
MAEGRPPFDPYGVLQALDRQRVKYVVIGGFARVLQGTEELTRGLDIVPSLRGDNLRRLDAALQEIHAKRSGEKELEPLASSGALEEPVVELVTDHGVLKVIPTPIGTQGYDDLRRAAQREPLGRGVRPEVASIGDLARMSTALGTEQDLAHVRQLRRLTALERGRSRVIER